MRSKGFTLLEMAITMAIISLALSVGIPEFGRLVRDASLSGLTSNYLHAFNTARYAAVSAGRSVSICRLDATNNCGGGWGEHFSVFYDDDRNGRLAASEDLIQVVDFKTAERINVTFKAFGRTRYVLLRSSGAYRQNGTFRFCPAGGGDGRAIVINVAGRARTEKIRCG